jgi:2-iminobutanoate/2-iminopropanoate deaminase
VTPTFPRRIWVVLPVLSVLRMPQWLMAQSKKESPVNQKREVRLSSPATLSKPMGYSHLAEVANGRVVYIAGQVPLDREGQPVAQGDFRGQVRQVFENLNEAVKAAGGSFADLIKLNYYCVDRVDRSQLTALREERDRYVNTQAPPVSTLVFVHGLVRPEWLIEIEAVAVV